MCTGQILKTGSILICNEVNFSANPCGEQLDSESSAELYTLITETQHGDSGNRFTQEQHLNSRKSTVMLQMQSGAKFQSTLV